MGAKAEHDAHFRLDVSRRYCRIDREAEGWNVPQKAEAKKKE